MRPCPECKTQMQLEEDDHYYCPKCNEWWGNINPFGFVDVVWEDQDDHEPAGTPDPFLGLGWNSGEL